MSPRPDDLPPDDAALDLATEIAAQLRDEIAEMQRHAALARASHGDNGRRTRDTPQHARSM